LSPALIASLSGALASLREYELFFLGVMMLSTLISSFFYQNQRPNKREVFNVTEQNIKISLPQT